MNTLPQVSASFHFSTTNNQSLTEKSTNNNRSSLNLSTADYATIGKKKQEPVYTEQELKECTFKPKISENSKQMIQDYTIDPVQERTRQILEQREKRLQEIRNQLEEKKQLTFKPSIAEYSFKGKRTSFMDSIDEQIQKRKEFLEKCEKERKEKELQCNVATFTPQISEASKQLGCRGGSVFDRLAIPKQYTDEQDDLYSTISKTPKSRDTKVDDKLYNEAKEREYKRKQIEETTKEEEKKLKTTKVGEKSNEVLKSKMLKDLSSAFKSSDKQDKGTISKNEFEYVLSNLGLKAMKNDDLEVMEKIWNLIDSENSNSVTFQQYNTIMLSILDNSFITQDQEVFRNQIEELSTHVKRLSLNKLAYCKIDEQRFEKVKKENDKELTFKPNTLKSTTPKKVRPPSNAVNTTTTTVTNGTNSNTSDDTSATAPVTVSTSGSSTGVDQQQTIVVESVSATALVDGGPNESNEPRFMKLIKKQNQVDERKKKEMEEWEKKKMSDCTFKPKTNSKKLLGFTPSTMNGSTRFDSLYNMAFQPKKLPNEKTREEKEMEECTFKPNRTNTKKFEMKSLSKSVDFDSIRGIKETVGRLRKGNEERERLFTYFNSLRDRVVTDVDDYKHKKTLFKPFSFQLDKRKRSKPVLYMDVNLGVGRSGRIGIHNGDRAEDLALHFAQTYKIDEVLQKRLEDLIRQNMMTNQHLFNHYDDMTVHECNTTSTRMNHDDNVVDHTNEMNDTLDQKNQDEPMDEQMINGQDELTMEDLNNEDEVIALSKSNVANLSIYDESKEPSSSTQHEKAITNSTPMSPTNSTTTRQSATTTTLDNARVNKKASYSSALKTNVAATNRLPSSYRSKTPTMKNPPLITDEKRSKTPTTDRYQSNNKFKF